MNNVKSRLLIYLQVKELFIPGRFPSPVMKAFLAVGFLIVSATASLGQNNGNTVYLDWSELQEVQLSESVTYLEIYFNGAGYRPENGNIPVFSGKIALDSPWQNPEVTITDPVYEQLPSNFANIRGIESISSEISFTTVLSYDKKKPFAVYSFAPVRRNPATGQYEKLVSFMPELALPDTPARASVATRSYKNNSVLASGKWVKVALNQTGIYRISYDNLAEYGFDPAGIDPRNIKIFGNGGGMLPEDLDEPRYDDLQENSILVAGEDDGSFDQGDYILFYGESPNSWKYNEVSGRFSHSFNIYSDYTYYFLTVGSTPGKRVAAQQQSGLSATNISSSFTDRQFHEIDQRNLANTGRIWYGEVFDVNLRHDILFSFPNIITSEPAYISAYVAAKSSISSSFNFYDGSNLIFSGAVAGIPATSDTYARTFKGSDTFLPSGNELMIRVEYQKSTSNSIGWLNYITLNATRSLVMSGNQMGFRDPLTAGQGNITEFRLGNAGSEVTVWNVTDPLNPRKVNATQNGQQLSFILPNDSLQEFMVYDGSAYLSVPSWESIPNQNLHATEPTEMIIITHPDFRDQAERLASHHRNFDGMSVLITEPQKIYNEFSSGAQDITAIRDFMKMLYDKAPSGEETKYLLLFGDASFDYKDRIENNSNYVPTWEDSESLTIVYSVATDDFYGFLDGGSDNLLDIGIGRLPVETYDQAVTAVDKIIDYATSTDTPTMGDWRNTLCFVADDEDGNMHFNQAEEMAKRIDTTYGRFNIDKIYVDAFPQEITPGGQRTPEVNSAINDRIQQGTLLMNFTGHGGEVGWGHERFLEISDINSWSNPDMLPIFITATCEFSRYDDPERVSAGELVFRHEDGGAIAMFTTARATFGGSNFNLNQALFDVMFELDNEGEHYRFGDLIRISKNKNGVVENDKKFTLLGNPALKLPYPSYDINTTEINSSAVSDIADTLKALSKVTITGEVIDFSGSKATGYNGIIYPKVYDKASTITTLATDDGSYPREFKLQKNIIYKGKARVTNGDFSFTFIVPKDIAYNYGFGKISYYSNAESSDASGYYKNIIVGGFDNDAPTDSEGPEISLYMNDESFVFGGITNENPVILAFVNDENGINTVGSGIGHDIVAILDENSDKPIVLNDYYESDLDSYKSGSIRYPISELKDGRHSLSLKVWDVHNNSSQEYTEFVVAREAELALDHVLNYPNPFTTHTDFFFEHNQPGSPLEVQVQIFTVSGKLIKTIDALVLSNGFRSDPISWNGTDDFGDRIGRGVYLYKVRVRNSNGEYAEKLEKLVILR